MLTVALNNWNNSKEKLALLDLSFFDLFIYNLLYFFPILLKIFSGKKITEKGDQDGKIIVIKKINYMKLALEENQEKILEK